MNLYVYSAHSVWMIDRQSATRISSASTLLAHKDKIFPKYHFMYQSNAEYSSSICQDTKKKKKTIFKRWEFILLFMDNTKLDTDRLYF